MKIVVMSDSHGFDQAIDKVLAANKDADFFIHCGDLCSYEQYYPNVIFVKGNNDYHDFPNFIVREFNGINILIIHSHQVGYFNREETLYNYAMKFNCQIVLYGHTHNYNNEIIRGVQLLNPGSLWHNRDGSNPSYAILEIFADKTYKIERKSVEK